ncbi:Highly reducing polyketide synthase otaA [Cladobotryum mycophilum]|uniref:Highly reducing polyketide synthase otaA n=1 Tax=Cladobotryum mycophilum TaxID=491253 RepID=A0ABR0SDQ4_9HYPO
MVLRPPHEPEPLAIIGLSCRYGGEADSAANLFESVLAAKSVYGPVPKDRFDAEFYYHPDQNRSGTLYTKGGYFLAENPGSFDSSFFQLPSQDVLAMDSQQKLLLENTYHALENAGIRMADVKGTPTSVFVGCTNNDHLALANTDLLMKMKCKSTGTAMSLLANRISWFYDLRGTSQAIDTACSSGLTAFHLACNDVRLGQSSMAIVSGVNLIEHPGSIVSLCNIGVLSPDGQCFSYDQKGAGFGRGEGVGTVIVKSLRDALRDGNRIRSVVRITGSNQDGKTAGITLPNHLAQQRLIQNVYELANLDPRLTSYFEAHGTGTAVGDPLEMKAITAALFTGRETPLYIGSLKAVIGHQEGGAGIAGLINAVLAVESGQIPPITNFENLNENITPRKHLAFAKRPTSWPRDDVRRASVNSFGYGGTNAHVVLDDVKSFLRTHPHYPQDILRGPVARDGRLHGLNMIYSITAFDEQGIQRNADRLLKYLNSVSFQDDPDGEATFLARLQHTLNHKRASLNWRNWVIAPGLDALRRSLGNKLQTFKTPVGQRQLRFIFTGQGAGWVGMGSDLLVYPLFRQRIEEASVYLERLGSHWNLSDVISMRTQLADPNEPTYAQSASVAIQTALVDLMASWGLVPSTVVGHSSGEIAAAYCAGKISRQAAWKVAFCRGLACTKVLDRGGSMMAAAIGEADGEAFLSKTKLTKPRGVVIGCINSPKSITFTGNRTDIVLLKGSFDAADVNTKILPVKVAYHSSDMEIAGPEYLSFLGSLNHGEKVALVDEVVMVSSVTGLPVTIGQVEDPAYWVKNMVSPVRFSSALARSLSLGVEGPGLAAAVAETIVEIGPHSALKAPVRETLAELPDGRPIQYCSLLRRGESNRATLLDSIGILHCKGYQLNLDLINDPFETHKELLDLPPYCFDHSQSYRATSRTVEMIKFPPYKRHELLGVPVSDTNSFEQRWRNVLRLTEIPWLTMNNMQGKAIFPGVAHMAMAAEAILQRFRGSEGISGVRYRQVSFDASLIIPDTPEGIEIIFSLQPDVANGKASDEWFVFRIISYGESESCWTEHCVGHVSVEREGNTFDRPSETKKLRSLMANTEFTSSLDVDNMYAGFESVGMGFGALLRNMQSIKLSTDRVSCLSSTKLPGIPKIAHDDYLVHPCVFESILHSLLTICGPDVKHKRCSMVATHIKEAWISTQTESRKGMTLDCFATAERVSSTTWRSHVLVESVDLKSPNILIQGIDLVALPSTAEDEMEKGRFYNIDWKPDVKLLKSIEPVSDAEPRAGSLRDLTAEDHRNFQLVSSIFILETLEYLHITDLSELPPHHEIFIKWMEKQKQLINADDTVLITKSEIEAIYSNPALKRSLVDRVAARSARGEFLVRVGGQITPILEKKVDCLDLMFSMDDLMERTYTESIPGTLAARVATYLKHLWHNLPEIKVLEIGGGTGSATHVFFESLSQTLEDSRFPRESYSPGVEYHFTDISSAFFGTAQTRFRKWSDVLQFKTLDVEQHAADQGFELASYDLIIACNVLHATKDLEAVLKNVKSLLKHGGDLLLIENVRPDLMCCSMAFGPLPGWWLSSEDFRQQGPLIDDTTWHTQLQTAGLEPRIHIKDSEEDAGHEISAFIASARQSAEVADTAHCLIVHFHQQIELISSLEARFCKKKTWRCSSIEFGQLSKDALNKSDCIVVLGMKGLDLSELGPHELQKIQLLVNTSQNILWVTGDPEQHPKDAMVHGLLRSLRWERYDESVNFITLGIHDPYTETGGSLAEEISNVCCEAFGSGGLILPNAEFIFKDGTLLTGRLQPANGMNTSLNSTGQYFIEHLALGTAETPLKLTSYESAPINRLGFVADHNASRQLGKHEVQIEVRAVHLTQQELVGMSEAVPGTEVGRSGAGIVKAIGSAVKTLRTGDSVMFINDVASRGTFRTSFTVDQRAAVKIPSELSPNQAATIPFAFCTAYHALVNVANLKPRHTVVIEASLQEISHAAITLAKISNASVVVLAASGEDSRVIVEYHGLSADCVISIDEGSVSDKILALTGGNGADIFVGRGMSSHGATSWMSKFGHIICIQHRDSDASERQPLTTGRDNFTYSNINMQEYQQHRPDGVLDTFGELASILSKHDFAATQPITTMSFANIKNAIEKARQGEGSQWTVFVPQQDDLVPVCKKPLGDLCFSADATYVMLGGFGGIGRSILCDELTVGGCTIEGRPCDISDRDAIQALLDDCRLRMPPIKGCVQCSMVLRDAMFTNMTYEQYTEAIRAKVQGSLNAAQLLPKDIDFFIMLSSSATVIGNRGQANYAAANAFMDSFAKTLVQQGVPATTISLGSILSVGWLAENSIPVALSYDMTGEDRLLSIIEYHMDPRWGPAKSAKTCHTIAGLRTAADFLRDGVPLPYFMSLPLFSYFMKTKALTKSNVAAGGGTESIPLATLLKTVGTMEQAVSLMTKAIISEVSSAMLMLPNELEPARSMVSYGIDSLVAVDLRSWFKRSVGVSLGTDDILSDMSMEALAEKVIKSSSLVPSEISGSG